MKIAICDDNSKDRLRIKQWFTANRPEIKQEDIVEFSSGEAFLRYLRNNPIDIVYLDCQMSGLDGISTTQEIRGNGGDVIVILVSNYTEYAVHGYELDVFRYILKSDFQMKAAIVFEKALTLLEHNAQKTYWVKSWGKSEKISVDEILYIESHRHKVDIFLKNRSDFSQYKKLDTIEENLKECGFIRCHQSYLVNSRYIRRMERNAIELDNGNFIPVSRERYKDAYDMLSLWVLEAM